LIPDRIATCFTFINSAFSFELDCIDVYNNHKSKIDQPNWNLIPALDGATGWKLVLPSRVKIQNPTVHPPNEAEFNQV